MIVRREAVLCLEEVSRDGAYANLIVPNYTKKLTDARQEGLFRRLVYGTLENLLYLDYILEQVSGKKLESLDERVLWGIRIGTYQLCFMDLKDHGAIYETVEAIKRLNRRHSAGFVNGVLRSVQRKKEKLLKIEDQEPLDELSIKTSIPKFILEQWLELWGINTVIEIAESFQKTAKFFIRPNPIKIADEILLRKLEEQGYTLDKSESVEHCYSIEKPFHIVETNAFKEGLFAIQDSSSINVVNSMNIESTDTVLDMCAAPGGKACHIAALATNGAVVAADIYEHKVGLIKDYADRMGIKNMEVVQQDSRKERPYWCEKFDKILLDAPCSGLGVIGRKPDLRWKRKREDISELAAIQSELLEMSYKYLKPGGILTYSVCTMSKEETVDHFYRLDNNPNWERIDELEGQFLLPMKTEGDGFYVMHWKKRA
ncbi:MAG: 16S rRNA (cytosine(967)-C(5))-methyltransferase RsmB [Tissierellia bacterium]|nr:16S rRNA (cytosine(967)-C(5))-methyltransferase RsmB [Tissierellia bacterium]